MTVKECINDAGLATGVLACVGVFGPLTTHPMTPVTVGSGPRLLDPVAISPSFRNLIGSKRAVLKTNAVSMTKGRRTIGFEMSTKHQL